VPLRLLFGNNMVAKHSLKERSTIPLRLALCDRFIYRMAKVQQKVYSANFALKEFSEVRATLRRLSLLRTDHQDWAVGMAHNRVRDAAHQHPSHSAKPPTAHHDQARTYVLSNLYDLLGTIPLGLPEMLLGDRTSLLLDLRRLLVEDVLRSLPELVDH
jgi:hypothetical protein